MIRSLRAIALAVASAACALQSLGADGSEQPLWLIASAVFIVAADQADRP